MSHDDHDGRYGTNIDARDHLETTSDTDEFYPDRASGLNSRFVLGLLLLALAAAIVLALWSLLAGGSDDAPVQAAQPTPLTLPTSAPTPTTVPTVTPGPLPTMTPVPAGFAACSDDQVPVAGRSYLVNTNTTPLKQRLEPSISGELVGSYAPATAGLRFDGTCLVNVADGYVWWQINADVGEVWVASDFLSPN